VFGSWLEDFSLRGYVRETPVYWQPSPLLFVDNDYRFDNLLHNRSNFRWYANDYLTYGLEIKTRLYTGQTAQILRGETGTISSGVTQFDWDYDFIDKEKTVLTSVIDRGWINISYKSSEFTIGRQRIAWGTNYVWNPIDIFNPSSPLDFDNEEIPGADALRWQLYTGPNSKMEFAYAKNDELYGMYRMLAMLVQVNKWEYDWIFMGAQKGIITYWGFAWAGSILDGGFRGELLTRAGDFFILSEDSDLTASISGDYTFSNTLYLHSAILYNNRGTVEDAGGYNLLRAYQKNWLSPAKLSVFSQVAKDLTPLVRLDLSGIINPNDKSWYMGPSISWSAMTNLDVTFTGLLFGGDQFTEFGDNGEILMARIKYSY
jgi:hypothetical protein